MSCFFCFFFLVIEQKLLPIVRSRRIAYILSLKFYSLNSFLSVACRQALTVKSKTGKTCVSGWCCRYNGFCTDEVPTPEGLFLFPPLSHFPARTLLSPVLTLQKEIAIFFLKLPVRNLCTSVILI